MRVISKGRFIEAAERYPNNKVGLRDAYRALNEGAFNTPGEMMNTFPSLDNFKYEDKWYVIDVGGNNLRVILYIVFAARLVYVKHILTHAEYNKLIEKHRCHPKNKNKRE